MDEQTQRQLAEFEKEYLRDFERLKDGFANQYKIGIETYGAPLTQLTKIPWMKYFNEELVDLYRYFCGTYNKMRLFQALLLFMLPLEGDEVFADLILHDMTMDEAFEIIEEAKSLAQEYHFEDKGN